jgi:hypothetical protein
MEAIDPRHCSSARVKPRVEILAPRSFGQADGTYSKSAFLGITSDFADSAGRESCQPYRLHRRFFTAPARIGDNENAAKGESLQSHLRGLE